MIDNEPTPGTPAEAPASTSQPSGGEPITDASAADGDDPDGTAQPEPSEADKVRHSMKQDMGKLRQRVRTTEQALQETQRELARYKQAENKLVPPKEEDFDNEDEYHRAVGKYEAKKELLDDQQKQAGERARQQEADRIAEISNNFRKNEAAFAKTVADYADTADLFNDLIAEANPRSFSTQVISNYVLESEDGPKVGYHLAKNPDVMRRLLEGSHFAAIRELGRISIQLDQGTAAPASGTINQPKLPPNPPNPIGGKGKPSAKPLWELDGDAYRKERFGK